MIGQWLVVISEDNYGYIIYQKRDIVARYQKTTENPIREQSKENQLPYESFLRAHEELVMRMEQSTAELLKAHAENQQLLEAITSILITLDQDNQIIQFNSVARTAFGISREDILGQPFAKSGIQWEWDRINQAIADCQQENRQVRVDDVRYTRPDGSDGFLGLTINPITKEKDQPGQVLLFGADITERKIMQSQLSRSQKLEAIGQLASGIAHEINTPTQYIGDNTYFLRESFGDLLGLLEKYGQLLTAAEEGQISGQLIAEIKGTNEKIDVEYLISEIPRAIQQSLEGIERVTSIVKAMKEFAHPGSEEKTPIDINKAIASTITVARNEWKYVAEMKTDYDPHLPLVSCLPGEFNQVILNMVINAADTIRDVVGDGAQGKGTITIQTRQAGAWAEIRISDTGTGIPKNVHSRIFEVFFTTKKMGKGSGQGLAISRAVVVDKHGGTIDFETEMGKGTTFIIRLPIVPEAAIKVP